MRKKWLTVAIFFSIIGIIAASISLYEYFHLLKSGFEEASFCAISETINCDIVNASSYATLFGVPMASWGLLFYFTLFCFAFYARFGSSHRERAISFAWFMSLAAFLWSLRMAYVSYAIIHAVCITCLAQYAINLLLTVILYFSSVASLKERFSLVFSKKAFSHVLTAAIIFGIGYVFSLSAVRGAAGNIKPEDVQAAVDAHFKQSLYDIRPEEFSNDRWGAASAPVWGNPESKVTIIEFSDFECPFCRIAAFSIRPYLYEFKDKVRFIFLNYPLDNTCNKYMDYPMHKNSCMAARVGVCAQWERKFWEYHDDVFKNQKDISRGLLKKLTVKHGFAAETFDDCLNSDLTLKPLQTDIETARHIYLNGTPSIFINNRLLRAWRSPEVLRAVVKKEIKRSY